MMAQRVRDDDEDEERSDKRRREASAPNPSSALSSTEGSPSKGKGKRKGGKGAERGSASIAAKKGATRPSVRTDGTCRRPCGEVGGTPFRLQRAKERKAKEISARKAVANSNQRAKASIRRSRR